MARAAPSLLPTSLAHLPAPALPYKSIRTVLKKGEGVDSIHVIRRASRICRDLPSPRARRAVPVDPSFPCAMRHGGATIPCARRHDGVTVPYTRRHGGETASRGHPRLCSADRPPRLNLAAYVIADQSLAWLAGIDPEEERRLSGSSESSSIFGHSSDDDEYALTKTD